MEHAFDVAIADLYSDEARIENLRTYPGGVRKKLSLPAPTYKQLIREAMPLAKAKDDRSKYSAVTYTTEGSNVRIKGQRFSLLKKYTSPMSLLVGPEKDGNWRILEELSESQP